MKPEEKSRQKLSDEPSSKSVHNNNENKIPSNNKNENGPGGIENAAGMNNTNKAEQSGKIGTEPVPSVTLDRGE